MLFNGFFKRQDCHVTNLLGVVYYRLGLLTYVSLSYVVALYISLCFFSVL